MKFAKFPDLEIPILLLVRSTLALLWFAFWLPPLQVQKSFKYPFLPFKNKCFAEFFAMTSETLKHIFASCSSGRGHGIIDLLRRSGQVF